MVVESVAAKILNIGSVVFEIWPFYPITLRSAFVSITKNEHDETTNFVSMEHSNCLITLYCCFDIWVIKHVTMTSNDPVTFWGHKLGQTDHKGYRDLWGHKVGHGDL